MNTYFYAAINRLKKASFFIPFTIYFIVFIVVSLFFKNLINQNDTVYDSSYGEILFLLIKVAIFFAIAFLSFSLFSVVVSWVHFLYWKRKTGIVLQINTNKSTVAQLEKQEVHLHMKPVLKPFFGFIKIRLQYDNQHFSEKFSLAENSSQSFFGNTLEGHYHWALPQIKEYRIEKAVVYFEDVFQFFSLATSLAANSRFIKHPVSKDPKELNAMPRKTEETNTRIEQMRKVEGELLSYKNFENNDDVRRIVWKIYAKNKELVVRIPEIMDPYASHIYLYPSFFTHFEISGNETIEIPFLNFYKNITWSVYQSLVKQGFEVKYIADTDIASSNLSTEQERIKYAVSTATWHQNKDLKSFVKTKDASVVIISSLSNAEQVRELTVQYENEIRFIFVKLTDSFRQQNMIDWVQWLFVRNEQQDMDVYKRKWALSLLKEKIKNNEAALEKILDADKYELIEHGKRF